MPRRPTYKLNELNLVLAFYEALDSSNISHQQKDAIINYMQTKIEAILPKTGTALNDEAEEIWLNMPSSLLA